MNFAYFRLTEVGYARTSLSCLRKMSEILESLCLIFEV
jgi:hypothetical protein